MRRAYAIQRLVYALAGLRTGASTVEVVHCFLERPAEPVTVTFTQSDRSRLETELEGRAAGIIGGEFGVSPAPHRGLAPVPGRGWLRSWPLAVTRRESPDTLF